MWILIAASHIICFFTHLLVPTKMQNSWILMEKNSPPPYKFKMYILKMLIFRIKEFKLQNAVITNLK